VRYDRPVRTVWHWQAVAMACGVAAACSSPPAAPTGAAAVGRFAGTWVPIVSIDSCSGSHECIALGDLWIVLRLAQDAAQVRGSGYVGGHAFDVNATVDSSGQMTITTPSKPSFSLDELSLQSNPASGLSGTIRYTSGPSTVRGHINSARRGPLESTQTTVQGRWIGNSIVRSCSLSGLTECPRLSQLFGLSLSQNGGTTTGNLDLSLSEQFRVPVSGTFMSSVLTLGGASARPQIGGTYQQRITAWASRADAFGRMEGTFTLEEETVLPDHRALARYESDLQDVYLLPDWLDLAAFAGKRVALMQPTP
jgi:hypothetical protein